MFIPLVDILRCPTVHEETWLVASIDRAHERDIVEGMLGCPSCFAEYPIRDGVVVFDAKAPDTAYGAPSDEDAVRLAAALDLTDARMTAVLQGEWAVHAPLVVGMAPAQLILVNAPDGISSGDGISLVRAPIAPLAHGSVHAAAFDASASAEMVASLVSSLRANGRLLGPASVPIPSGLTELARDDEVWVAQMGATATTSAPVTLGRRKPSSS